jgi:uncharacterized protein
LEYLAFLLWCFAVALVGGLVGLVLGNLRLPATLLLAAGPAAGAGANLMISAVAAGTAAIAHVRAGRVNWTLVAWMAPASVAGAVGGALLSGALSGPVLLGAISVVLAVSGVQLLRLPPRPRLRAGTGAGTGAPTRAGSRAPLRAGAGAPTRAGAGAPTRAGAGAPTRAGTGAPTRAGSRAEADLPTGGPDLHVVRAALSGALIGVLGGIVGLILGSLRMPALLRVVGEAPARAAGTNVVVGLFVGVAGALGHLPSASPDWGIVAIGSAGSIPGALLGSRLTGRLNEHDLVRAIGFVLLVAAAGTAIQAVV